VSVRQQQAAEVRSIYRKGDHVLVRLPSGVYRLVVQSAEIVGGELWLDGEASEFSKYFPARCVVRRLRPSEPFTLPKPK
jgi:hypothetical protein